MYQQVEKRKENKSRAVANSVTQMKSNRNPSFAFVDNRPEAIVQREMKAPANDFPVAQLQLTDGRYRLKRTFFNTNLRNDNPEHTVGANLIPGTVVTVIPKGIRVSNFRGRLLKNEHSCV